MKEYCGNHFILNGNATGVGSFDNTMVFRGETIYEVVRLVNGIPVFFMDHISRLENSLEIKSRRMLADKSDLKAGIDKLTSIEKKKEINIKIVFNFRAESENWLIYYIDSVYPSQEQYRHGVKGLLFYGMRHDPQSKVLDFRLRSAINQELAEEGAYEALLVNEEDMITEGSRSNIFFLKDKKLVTAPDDMILKGITRRHLLEICGERGIPVEFRCVGADDLSEFESVFMTGTSPMILPFRSVENLFFDVNNELFEELRNLYMKRVEASLQEYRASDN
jgi:branched-chain amino acid aminotransferase